MGPLLLFLAVLSSCLGWPVNRWVSRGGGSVSAYGFAANATVVVLSAGAALLVPEARPDRLTLLLAGLGGVCIVAGYWTVVMHCLRIGPASPTVAIYSMSLLWPVVLGAWLLAPRHLRPLSVLGIVLVIVALGVCFTGPPSQEVQSGTRPSGRWFALSLAGWVLGGLTMTLLMAAQFRSPGSTIHICLAYSVVASALLAPGLRGASRRRITVREVGGGAAAGLFMFTNSVTVLAALRWLGPQLVYTLPTVVPIIVMLLVAHIAYRERLTPRGWLTCAIGLLAVTALAAGG